MPIKMFFKGYISGVFVFVCFIYLFFKKEQIMNALSIIILNISMNFFL